MQNANNIQQKIDASDLEQKVKKMYSDVAQKINY